MDPKSSPPPSPEENATITTSLKPKGKASTSNKKATAKTIKSSEAARKKKKKTSNSKKVEESSSATPNTKSEKQTTPLQPQPQPLPPLKKNAKVLDKIIYAIRSLKSNHPKGSSRAALSKYLKVELDYDNPSAFKLALKKGVSNGTLLQDGQSFRVAADPIVHNNQESEEEALQINILKHASDGGTKEAASEGDNVTVSYIGKLDNGTVFDRASTFSFQLNGGEVIKGWDRGILGMKEGEKRSLIVPPKLGYGKRGCKPDIPPDATLHFVVTLKKIS
uniref:peptidylprolyl isomerase n=1 Tax=Ditylum brightwellii TaxID=49249 RepID=A0A7S1ZUK3_9STRA|mmetsp:Transcript_38652/g.58000  ORF Transcript_38652/g.58000 Transcript_38652/m.58000 type:complete len:277 (+) Transcript_38652:74-904(+)